MVRPLDIWLKQEIVSHEAILRIRAGGDNEFPNVLADEIPSRQRVSAQQEFARLAQAFDIDEAATYEASREHGPHQRH